MPAAPSVELTSLPKVDPTELRLLWVNDWYDGPLEAVVEHGVERRLMVLHSGQDVADDAPMRWVLFRLSADQWKEEERWHALFEEHVGHHWCFHHDPAHPPPEPPQNDSARRFYEPYATRTPRELDASAALGWVDEMPTR